MYDFASDPLIGLTQTRLGWMFYPRNDRYVGRSLELYGDYARLEYEVFRRIVRPGDTVVDAGANIGVHTVHFSALAGPGGHVLAFEPQRALFQILNANLMMNRCANVQPLPFCVGAEDGWVDFPQVPLDTPVNFGGIGRDTPAARRERTQTRAIDGFGLERCDFIKIDVEGAEASVIEGARRTISGLRPTLCVEAESAERIAGWFDGLRSSGYRAFRMVPLLFTPGNWKKCRENVFGRTININLLAFPGDAPDWAADPALGLRPADTVDAFFEGLNTASRA
ncbi:FkbM family methyltransferase [Azospirillum halopraeferens]|uniref:FkbM family methyltransferase n=1 Tax=Azospirillum halopraeferens TaxID=34010 RepID=UPI0003FCCBDF|nr:FkbM family methyltransferase [Azospirillum halopraeferens]